jgi:hypothetical protein
MVKRLENSITQLDKGNEDDAITLLMDFIDQIENLPDLSDKPNSPSFPTEEQKELLILEAQKIIDLING